MNPDYLLDTNVFIYLFNQRLVEPLPEGNPACSFYDLSESIKRTTIRLRRRYRLKLPDAIIAATALTENLQLLTNDREFHQIDELQCASLLIRE